MPIGEPTGRNPLEIKFNLEQEQAVEIVGKYAYEDVILARRRLADTLATLNGPKPEGQSPSTELIQQWYDTVSQIPRDELGAFLKTQYDQTDWSKFEGYEELEQEYSHWTFIESLVKLNAANDVIDSISERSTNNLQQALPQLRNQAQQARNRIEALLRFQPNSSEITELQSKQIALDQLADQFEVLLSQT